MSLMVVDHYSSFCSTVYKSDEGEGQFEETVIKGLDGVKITFSSRVI